MARKITYTGILQIDAHSISMLRFQLNGNVPKETSFLRITGSWEDAEAQQAALAEFIATHGLEQDAIYSILPRYDVTTRIITLPSHDLKEIAGMVRFSVEDYVPFTMDEVVIDQCVLRKLDSGEAETLIAIAHKDVVEKHLAVLREAGIAPVKVLLSTACVYSAAVATHPNAQERYALVCLSSGGIEISIIEGKNPVFTRGIAMTQDWEQVAENPDATGESLVDMGGAEDLAVELRGSLSAYRRETPDGEGVDAVYLACAYAPLEKLCESLSQKLSRECKPAHFILDAFGGETIALPGLPVEAVGGLMEARGQAGIKINLLPEKEAKARQIESIKTLGIRIAAGFAVALICLGILYFQAVHQRNSYIEYLETHIAEIAPSIEGINEKQEQLAILRRQVDRKGSIIEQLAHLVEAAPEGRLNFSRLSLQRSEGIDIWGRARSVVDVSAFTNNLRALAEMTPGNLHLNFFRAAHMVYEGQTMEYDTPVSEFEVTIPRLEEEDDS